ncbi:MAG: TetR/AcrR family transcriptional regulator [Sandaracinaceae bacterium]|nr:TetR/AcrR family transcriptional regulator [Sandaracinaceae bacterium]
MRKPAWGDDPPRDDTEARDKLLDAAERCVRRDGVEQTSLSSVAAEAGVSRRTVYRYFASGQELLAAAEIRAGGGLLDRIRRAADPTLPPRERLLRGLVAFVQSAAEDPLLSRYLDPRELDAATVVNEANIQRTLAQFAAVYYGAPLTRRATRELHDLGELILRMVASLCLVPVSDARARKLLELALGGALDQLPPTMPR